MIDQLLFILFCIHYDQQMLLLFILLVLDGIPFVICSLSLLFILDQQLLLLLILLVIDGNPLLFHCTLFHFDNRCYCCFIGS